MQDRGRDKWKDRRRDNEELEGRMCRGRRKKCAEKGERERQMERKKKEWGGIEGGKYEIIKGGREGGQGRNRGRDRGRYRVGIGGDVEGGTKRGKRKNRGRK
jgi:hypothetical protein